jgi:U3 small nucleolar RNA-associated protein 14
LKGWGNWAGPGISEKKVDPQEELRKKLKAI